MWHIVSSPVWPVGFLEYCVENDSEVDRKECCAHLARSAACKGGAGQQDPPRERGLRERTFVLLLELLELHP